MPYIPNERRLAIDGGESPKNSGELNYAITKLMHRYLVTGAGKINYQRYNDIVGAVEGAKLELYRKLISPYEESAIKRNGDI